MAQDDKDIAATNVKLESAGQNVENNDYFSQAIEQYEKRIYDLQQMLEITRSLCSTVELNTLIESILYVTMAQMRALAAGVFILNTDDGFDLGNNFSGFELDSSLSYSISMNSKLIEILSAAQDKVYTLKELREPLLAEDHQNLRILESLRATLIIPLISKNHMNGILVLGERISSNPDDDYDTYEKDEISIIASLASVAINNAFLVEKSSTDMMTKLKLKYYFFNILQDKLDASAVDGNNVSVMMFDIDFFKKFNDTYGHACGDYVLIEVAKLIKNRVRIGDLASRYGGEEFTVMLNNADAKEAVMAAERIRQSIESHDFFYQNQHMKVTISVGVAVYDKETNPVSTAKALVEQADQGLYVSKRNGRNRVTLVTPKLLETLAAQAN